MNDVKKVFLVSIVYSSIICVVTMMAHSAGFIDYAMTEDGIDYSDKFFEFAVRYGYHDGIYMFFAWFAASMAIFFLPYAVKPIRRFALKFYMVVATSLTFVYSVLLFFSFKEYL